MKLRLKNNSVRLRLTQNEVVLLGDSGRVEEVIEFGAEPHERFVYRLESGAESPRAVFGDNRLTVGVPQKEAAEWARTERVGMEFEQPVGGGKVLRLLIEKDYACLQPRAGDDDAGAFPHPSESGIC